MQKELILSVVTPEKSIVDQVAVDSIVLPGEEGQLNLLPGHINFITALGPGTFAYRVAGEWQIAFLSGGFTQVFNGQVTVLAETLDMAQDLDLAQTELSIRNLTKDMSAMKVGSPEFVEIAQRLEHAQGKLKAVQKKIF